MNARINDIKIRLFDSVSKNWLNFIRDNRTGGRGQYNFDVVRGFVANNNENSILLVLYIGGIYTINEVLEKMQNTKMNYQISIHTSKALSCLKLIIKTVYAYK